MIPIAARETLKKARKQGLHVKFIYTVPNFQNPAGVTLIRERRHELLEIAREFDLIIVEDNPYGMLRFEGEPLPTLAALEQEQEGYLVDRVVYLGTFSKIFAPGVRLGWVHAQPGILHKINIGKQGADLCSSNLSQMMISSYFQNADWRAYVKRLTTMYKPSSCPRRSTGRTPRAGSSCGRPSPRTSTLPRCSRGPSRAT
jgi:2-aminoadipate transaminase